VNSTDVIKLTNDPTTRQDPAINLCIADLLGSNETIIIGNLHANGTIYNIRLARYRPSGIPPDSPKRAVCVERVECNPGLVPDWTLWLEEDFPPWMELSKVVEAIEDYCVLGL